MELMKFNFNISVLFDIKESFEENDIEDFIRFIKEKHEQDNNTEEEYYFRKDHHKKASFYFDNTDSEVFIQGSLGIREVKTAVKIKDAILDKLEKLQLPFGEKNIIVIKCEGYSCDEHLINEAFLGQIQTNTEIDPTPPGNIKFHSYSRVENGLIHECFRKELNAIFCNISLFIIYDRDYENRIYIPNGSARNPIDKKVLENREI